MMGLVMVLRVASLCMYLLVRIALRSSLRWARATYSGLVATILPFISVTAFVASSGEEKQTKPKPLLWDPSVITYRKKKSLSIILINAYQLGALFTVHIQNLYFWEVHNKMLYTGCTLTYSQHTFSLYRVEEFLLNHSWVYSDVHSTLFYSLIWVTRMFIMSSNFWLHNLFYLLPN